MASDFRFAEEIDTYGEEIDFKRQGALTLVSGRPVYGATTTMTMKAIINPASNGSKEEWGIGVNASEIGSTGVYKIRTRKVDAQLQEDDFFDFYGDTYRIMYERKRQDNQTDFRIYFATKSEARR